MPGQRDEDSSALQQIIDCHNQVCDAARTGSHPRIAIAGPHVSIVVGDEAPHEVAWVVLSDGLAPPSGIRPHYLLCSCATPTTDGIISQAQLDREGCSYASAACYLRHRQLSLELGRNPSVDRAGIVHGPDADLAEMLFLLALMIARGEFVGALREGQISFDAMTTIFAMSISRIASSRDGNPDALTIIRSALEPMIRAGLVEWDGAFRLMRVSPDILRYSQ